MTPLRPINWYWLVVIKKKQKSVIATGQMLHLINIHEPDRYRLFPTFQIISVPPGGNWIMYFALQKTPQSPCLCLSSVWKEFLHRTYKDTLELSLMTPKLFSCCLSSPLYKHITGTPSRSLSRLVINCACIYRTLCKNICHPEEVCEWGSNKAPWLLIVDDDTLIRWISFLYNGERSSADLTLSGFTTR